MITGIRAGVLQAANDREAVLARHVQVEDDQVRRFALDQLPQARSAIADETREPCGEQVVADHLARFGLVVDTAICAGGRHAAASESRRLGPARMSKTVPLFGPGEMDLDPPAVQLHDALGDEQAQPGRVFPARGPRREPLKPSEQAWEVLRQQVQARCRDADAAPCARRV